MSDSAPTVVFAGPSLPHAWIAQRLPDARVEPPAARGDVDQLLSEGIRTVLLLDGTFAHRLAVPPSELVRAVRAGVRVVGAASLGAIRAAECAPAGVEGIGAVAALYRLRVIADDDEVAVAMEPDRAHRAASVALINVRFAMLAALRHRLLDRSSAAAVLVAAKREHFSARHWKPLLAAAGVCTRPDLLRLCVATDVKRRDAELAVVRVAARASAAPRSPRAAPPVAPRYPGHDPLLGMTEAEARRGLARWLTDTGRYRRFTAEPPVAPAAVAQLWSELQDRHELHTELLHWHAVRVFEADGRP